MKLKQIPEDFYVKEINIIKLNKKGDHCYIWLKKKNWTTVRVVEALARRLGADVNKFHYAGLKDKDGITEQMISGYKIDTAFLKKIKIKDVELTIIGYGDEPVKLGGHQGNAFTVVVRDLDAPITAENLQIPNYFDDQRFGGSIRAVSHLIGEAIVEENYELAVKRILLDPFPEESNENKLYREKIKQQWPDMENITVPKNLFEEERVVKSLKEVPGNFKRAIGSLHRRILTLCIHAYQSYLFNLRLAEYVGQQEKFVYVSYVLGKLPIPLRKAPEKSLPLTGCEIISFPELNTRTILRPAFVMPQEFALSKPEKDELNKEKLKQTLTFALSSGSYATIVAKTLVARTEI